MDMHNRTTSRRSVLGGFAGWLGIGVVGGLVGAGGERLAAPPPRPAAVDPRQFGAVGDGRHDDTAAVTRAIFVAARTRGTVLLPSGVFRVAGVVIPSSITLQGQGMGQTVLQLVDGATDDVLITQNFHQLTGTNSNGGVAGVTLRDLTLDGNRARSPHGGWALRRYGYRWVLSNVEIRHAAAGGLYSEYGMALKRGADGDMMEDSWLDVRVHDNDGDGVRFLGPHDTRTLNLLIYANGGDGLKVEYCPSGGYSGAGILLQSFHAYWNRGVGLHCGGAVFGSLVEAESNGQGGVRIAASGCALTGLLLYSNGTALGTEAPGLIVGTPTVGVASGYFTGLITNNSTDQIQFVNDAGYNTAVLAVGSWTPGSHMVSGEPSALSHWTITPASPPTVPR